VSSHCFGAYSKLPYFGTPVLHEFISDLHNLTILIWHTSQLYELFSAQCAYFKEVGGHNKVQEYMGDFLGIYLFFCFPLLFSVTF
jgi:acid phosphatase family membrane protein YuiD